MCFTNKGFVGIHSEPKFASLVPIIHKKNYYDRYYDILLTVAQNVRQNCFKEFLQFSVYLTS